MCDMKKSLILSMIGLMLSIVTASGGNPRLKIGEMWMEGSGCAKLVQRLYVKVTNISAEDYHDWSWWAVNGQAEELSPTIFSPSFYGNSEEVFLAPGETKVVAIDMIFEKEGHYDVYVIEPTSAWGELFVYSVDISEYKAPRIKCDIHLDMLEQTEEGNILYGDYNHFRITGTATITYDERYPYYGLGHLMVDGGYGLACVVNPWFGSNNGSANEPFYALPSELRPGTFTCGFSYDFVAIPEEGKKYGIEIKTLTETIASIPFKVRQCTNTYWTADGHVKPLPVKDNQVLEIPAEALTVDLRGLYEMNTIFSVDVSQANPNCLYFLGYLDNVPQGFSSAQNVIRDYEAKMITIDGNKDYYCPMPFNAKEGLFIYTPEPINPLLSRMTGGTFFLPFDATKAWLTSANDSPGNDADFYGNTLQIFRYSGGNSGDKIGFEPVWGNRLIAYEPYYISSPPSPITFYAENVTIPSTRPAIAEGAEYDFIGYTTQIAVPDGAYQWNADDCCFYLSNLEEKITWASPFSAMMYAKTFPYTYDKLLLVVDDDPGSGATRIDAIRDVPSEKVTVVYSLSGQRVGTAEVNEGRLTTSGLRPGIYIIGGKKVIVK
jgi:hypothetical protein